MLTPSFARRDGTIVLTRWDRRATGGPQHVEMAGEQLQATQVPSHPVDQVITVKLHCPRHLCAYYGRLLDTYGPQGWWPVVTGGARGENWTPDGYHPLDYGVPRARQEVFEICCGAILTQNTAWFNVQTAIARLLRAQLFSPPAILAAPIAELEQAITTSGYFRVKTRKLKEFARFFHALSGATPERRDLLAVWGIGPETADSMRLYAFRQTEMVVDAYTRRILVTAGAIAPAATYDEIKAFCVAGLPARLDVYQEFHALIVAHAKRHYRRAPYQDPLLA